MKAYKAKKKIAANGVIHLDALPFREGELVEVIVIAQEEKTRHAMPSSLRGMVIEYVNPTEPIAEDDWEVLQ